MEKGIYEQIINQRIDEELKKLKNDYIFETEKLTEKEASRKLSLYLQQFVEKALNNFKSNKTTDKQIVEQINLINKIVDFIISETGLNSFQEETIHNRGELLLSLLGKDSAFSPSEYKFCRPETSIASSTLFTGSHNEPSLAKEILKEIKSCNRVDLIVSFIKWNGLRLLLDAFKEFTENGGKLRVITTTYMRATEYKALEELLKLKNTEIKISYDTNKTRLHAKSYIFWRNTGFSTAYIGSSNISVPALTGGLEWNVKITLQDQPLTMKKINLTFDNYWNDSDFEIFAEQDKEKLKEILKEPQKSALEFYFDIKPYRFQEEILEKLKVEREVHNNFKNLVVAATGTGKTVISAWDYQRYTFANPTKNRLLFIAHREEILDQSLACFRAILKDPNFGDKYVGGYIPESYNHLFCSIQTFNSKELWTILTDDYYDFLIVDEFHHSAAPSYQVLLNYFKPKILLGLTATPERMDGEDILKYFNGKITSELRLPEAIDRQLLCPFHYFGVSDSVDLSQLKWIKGGYDRKELTQIYITNNVRVEEIINSIYKYISNFDDVIGLGFCASIEHAMFMADQFNNHKIPSYALTGFSEEKERREAKSKLQKKEFKFLFVVDIYNEGVDIPEINTVLFLRPTESLTIFLQQLGRGLRLHESKECLTVLDFIGNANKNYRFEEKYQSLLAISTSNFEQQIKTGFDYLPNGCFLNLEKKAKEYILSNIEKNFTTKQRIVEKIRVFINEGKQKLSLANFCQFFNQKPETIYHFKTNITQLAYEEGLIANYNISKNETLNKALLKISQIDSFEWLNFLLENLPKIKRNEIFVPSSYEYKMLVMFYYTIFNEKISNDDKTSTLLTKLSSILQGELFDELIDLIKYNIEKIDFVEKDISLKEPCPIKLHCSYTLNQILVALGVFNENYIYNFMEGVHFIKGLNLDVFFVTVNKDIKHYSLETMYKDYAINDELFNWESQNKTSTDSTSGYRYINHQKMGTKILLFVRANKTENGLTSLYKNLGLVDYLSHNGNKPISFVWKLQNKIPLDLYNKIKG